MKLKGKFKIGLIMALVLVVLLGGWWFLTNRGKASTAQTPSSICQKISIKPMRNYCLATVTQDASLCQKLEDEDQNTCLAIVKDDSSYCQPLAGEKRGVCCRDLAESRGNPEACKLMEDQGEINDCYSDFVAFTYYSSKFHLLKPEFCDQMSSQASGKAMCLAMTQGEASLCGESKECLAIMQKKPALCREIESVKDQEICLADVAMTAQKPELCQEIQTPEIKDNCYFDYAGHVAQDPAYCEEISDNFTRQMCYKAVAQGLVW